MNVVRLCCRKYSHRNFVADFPRVKCNFIRKIFFCVFEPPLGGRPRGMYDVHLRLTGKLVVDFLLIRNNVGLSLWHTFARLPLHRLGQGCSRWKTRTEAEHISPSDYRWVALNNDKSYMYISLNKSQTAYEGGSCSLVCSSMLSCINARKIKINQHVLKLYIILLRRVWFYTSKTILLQAMQCSCHNKLDHRK